jgi:hypothetical protein
MTEDVDAPPATSLFPGVMFYFNPSGRILTNATSRWDETGSDYGFYDEKTFNSRFFSLKSILNREKRPNF